MGTSFHKISLFSSKPSLQIQGRIHSIFCKLILISLKLMTTESLGLNLGLIVVRGQGQWFSLAQEKGPVGSCELTNQVFNRPLNQVLNLRNSDIFNGSSAVKNMFSNNKNTLEYRPEYNSDVGGGQRVYSDSNHFLIHFKNIYGGCIICQTVRQPWEIEMNKA